MWDMFMKSDPNRLLKRVHDLRSEKNDKLDRIKVVFFQFQDRITDAFRIRASKLTTDVTIAFATPKEQTPVAL